MTETGRESARRCSEVTFDMRDEHYGESAVLVCECGEVDMEDHHVVILALHSQASDEGNG